MKEILLHKTNLIKRKILCVNTSIAKPIVSIIHSNDTYETITHLELERGLCTPEELLSDKNIANDLECIYVITPDHENCQRIFPQWKSLLQNNPNGLSVYTAYQELILHNTIKNIPIILIDHTSMVLLSLASEEFYKTLSQKNPLLLCHAGEHKTAIISLYKNVMYSIFGFCSSLVEQDDFIQCVDELRSRVLKNEDVTLIGGCGSAFAKNAFILPEETPLYIIGKRSKKFTISSTILETSQQDTLIWNSIMFIYENFLLTPIQ